MQTGGRDPRQSDGVHPGVRVGETQGRAENAAPIACGMKRGAQPDLSNHHPLKFEGRKGIRPIIDRSQTLGVVVERSGAQRAHPDRGGAAGWRRAAGLAVEQRRLRTAGGQPAGAAARPSGEPAALPSAPKSRRLLPAESGASAQLCLWAAGSPAGFPKGSKSPPSSQEPSCSGGGAGKGSCRFARGATSY